jgi:hypothetical protein
LLTFLWRTPRVLWQTRNVFRIHFARNLDFQNEQVKTCGKWQTRGSDFGSNLKLIFSSQTLLVFAGDYFEDLTKNTVKGIPNSKQKGSNKKSVSPEPRPHVLHPTPGRKVNRTRTSAESRE